MSDDEYVCSLSEKTEEKAIKELGEDPRERLGAIQAFREWIHQQKHIKCDTSDTLFLLRFLRYAKWSQLRARQALEDYLTCFMTYRKWFHNIDTQHPAIQAYYKIGRIYIGGRDDNGSDIYGAALGRLDPDSKDYNKFDVMRASVALNYLNWCNEENQVNGYTYFFDCTGYTMRHRAYYTISEMIGSTKMWQKAFPNRFKGFHYYNGGPVLESLMKLVRPVVSKKALDRLQFHSTMVGVYKHIPQRCLPLEYLPDDYTGESLGTMEQVAENLLRQMTSERVRERILHYTNPQIFHIDLKEKVEVPNESFRKLNID